MEPTPIPTTKVEKDIPKTLIEGQGYLLVTMPFTIGTPAGQYDMPVTLRRVIGANEWLIEKEIDECYGLHRPNAKPTYNRYGVPRYVFYIPSFKLCQTYTMGEIQSLIVIKPHQSPTP